MVRGKARPSDSDRDGVELEISEVESEKPKYEPPRIVPLGQVSRGVGGCVVGSGAAGGCNTGSVPARRCVVGILPAF